MSGVKLEYFNSKEKAIKRAGIMRGNLFHYAEDSSTKDDYITWLNYKEGSFDEYYAKQFPYCVLCIEF